MTNKILPVLCLFFGFLIGEDQIFRTVRGTNHLNDFGMMKQSIQDGICNHWILKQLAPFGQILVTCNDRGFLLVFSGYELEKQFGNEPKYNSKFKQHMNYRDLYELTLNICEEFKLAYELKEMYRDFNKNCSYEKTPAITDYLIQLFEEADPACYKESVQLLKKLETGNQTVLTDHMIPEDKATH